MVWERKSEMLEIMCKYFDFREMANNAIGHSWKDRSPEKLQEFRTLFKLLIFDTYIQCVERHIETGDQIIYYDSERPARDHALIKKC